MFHFCFVISYVFILLETCNSGSSILNSPINNFQHILKRYLTKFLNSYFFVLTNIRIIGTSFLGVKSIVIFFYRGWLLLLCFVRVRNPNSIFLPELKTKIWFCLELLSIFVSKLRQKPTFTIYGELNLKNVNIPVFLVISDFSLSSSESLQTINVCWKVFMSKG